MSHLFFFCCQSITGHFSDGGADEVEVNCSLDKNQFVLHRAERGRGIPLKVSRTTGLPPAFNLYTSVSHLFSAEFNSSSLRRNSEVSCTFNVALLSFIFNIWLCLSLLEARLLSHQTPVNHRGSCAPIGRSAAWNRCGRGHHPADSQSESPTDTAGERASDISQRLGSSRCDTHCLC